MTAAADGSVVVWYFKKAMELEEELQQKNMFRDITREDHNFEPIPICTAKTNLFDMQCFD